ncbi:uncharacterized protein wu:fj29h11 isoform X2 [Syngnathoides biaculeatus]|uniref:uncharacterized protein wu:fj29h11 isoform X2 n=1 Tax=Syngnathoides biaculeatus TaxID=300417 RepID=UPI002ADD705D|nr:uncharacterized protein wu:fj29h11 isoform X2 [Syngnathoides biaculeatus]
MESVLEDVVAMVKQHPEGIPVGKLGSYYRKTYHRPLFISHLGFKTNAILLASLENDLFIEGNLVFHKDYDCNESTVETEAGTSAMAMSVAYESGKRKRERKTVKKLKNLVAMMTEYPEGILMKNLSRAYWEKYRQKLKLNSLGFNSISALLATLNNDLVVIGELVIHKIHHSQDPNGPGLSATPLNSEIISEETGASINSEISSSSPPLPVKALATRSKLTDELDQQNLLKKIIEVAEKYQLTYPSMDQLEVCYFHLYGEKLPFQLYLSMYDTLESSCQTKLPIPSGTGTTAEQQITGDDVSSYADWRQSNEGTLETKPRTSVCAATYDATKLKKEKKKVNMMKNVVTMMTEYPEGILMKNLAIAYREKYQKKMKWNSLGFSSVSALVATLSNDLVVMGELVIHKIHQSQDVQEAGISVTATSLNSEISSSVQPLPVKPLSTGVKLNDELDQQHLHKRTLEVVEKYQLTDPSMDLLEACYYHNYNEKLPFELYLSMYNSLKSSRQKSLPIPPATGTAVKQPAAASSSKTSGAARSECSASVFKEGFNAQLREVHRDNMRAQEAMVNDEQVHGWRKRDLDPDMLSSLMEDVIRDLAGEGELVTKEKVISRACMLMQLTSKESEMINPRSIQALNDLQYLVKEITMYIQSTEAMTSVCTLYELGQSLAALKNKKRYEELNLGPLCKLPLIHRMFKIDSNTKDDDIPQIETVDILKQLRNYRRRSTKPIVDLADFMKHLADHYKCESPYELGIRIRSLGLPIGTLSKVSRCEHSVMDQIKETIQKELEEETRDQFIKLKKNILEPVKGTSSSFAGNLDLRKKYASLTAAEVVVAVFTNAEKVFSPAMLRQHVRKFLTEVTGNKVARDLFQLAICSGSLTTPEDQMTKEKTPQTSEKTDPIEDRSLTSNPSEAKVKQYLKDTLSSIKSAIHLADIAVLEEKLTKHFQVKDFHSLGQGSFLGFLVKHIQLLQDVLGSTLILRSWEVKYARCFFRPTKQDIFEFIKQCGKNTACGQDELSHIELALRSYYGVQDSRDLGHGSLQTLARLVQCQKDLAGGGLSHVFYEPTLFAKLGILSDESGCEEVGRLGEMSKAQALASLHSCPLLEDLSEWSQWELIFKPSQGALKDFIERNAANTGLAALEVSPNLLLRITTDTGDKYFSKAAMTLDPVGTAGHLVSIVVADGITNAPTALLANHIQSSLAGAMANEDLSQAEEDMSCYRRVANFLLECLARIPNRICKALFQQVFLEPLSRVLGQTKSKLVLITVAQSNARHINCLHRLGILLGITEWVKDYEKKLTASEIQNGSLYQGPFDQPKVQIQSNVVDSGSVSLSGQDMSENDVLEDETTDSSLSSGHLNQNPQQGNMVQGEEPVEEESSEVEEFTSLSDNEMSENNSEADDVHAKEPEIMDLNEGEILTCPPDPTFDFHRTIIEEIRKNEFGIGVELTAEGLNLMQVHQNRLGRSLDRLSTELYSKDTHFVLELIQNADDNSYPSESGVVPALAFVVERDCITILNNETGFQEANIKAICDVGQSTKGKHKYGYIGQKGIGFKSVFKVTDRPEIHSNGFHLFFDKTCGPMGYILPHWMDTERPLDPQLNDTFLQSWTTKICLPLHSERHQTRNLFHDVHPSLLLFLHRLRSITIYSQAENRLVTMTRKDLDHNVLEVEHSDGTERWLVVKTTLQPKMLKENVDSTELALAFQLTYDKSGSDIMSQPQKQPVFAYLPLRSFGLRFIVQGDFDIPSSREDVDRDSSWNQWLRSEIPQLFLKAMKVFIDHPEFTGLRGLCQILQFIPLPDEVLDFFKPVASQIIQLLKGKAFLPTLTSDGQIVYKLPSQVAVCKDAVIRNVINQDELEKHLLLSYLHPNLSPAPPASLLSHLGVRNLRGSDVTTVTTAMAKELMKEETIHTDVGLHQLARLLVCNFRAVEHGYGDGDSILQTLGSLPIIPLSDGRVVALDGDSVFFPLEQTKTKKKKYEAQTGHLSLLYEDVNVVHPSLLSCVEPLENQQVRELLRRLGVHQLEPQELLEQHIYPVLKNEKWKSKPEAVVVSYLVFIKQHCTSTQEYADLNVPVLTNRGLLCPGQSRVHFSEPYGNMDLTKTLPGYDWVLLSPKYLQADNDMAGWRQLFTRLGVRDGLIIRKERQTLTPEQLSSSPWSIESTMWRQTPGEDYVLDDYPCEEFHALATAQLSAPCLLAQRKALLNLLATNWNTGHRYSQYLTAEVIDRDARPIKTTKSSFYHFLCRLKWMPAFRPQEGEKTEIKYLCPNTVYLNAPEITNLLGTHVYYVNMDPSEFSQSLGIQSNVSVDALIAYLKEWCVKPTGENENVSEGANFISTIQHIHNIYTYLHTNCPQNSLKDLFHHNPAVFILLEYRSNDWCSGRFYNLRDVCWRDPTRMFQRYRSLICGHESPIEEPKVLAPFYSELEGMKDFFIRLLNADGSPNMNQYVCLLELIASSSPIPSAEVLQDVSVLYATLADKCKIQVSGEHEPMTQSMLDVNYCSTLKGMVSDKKVFPTKENSWVSLARKPMIPDSKELEKVFKLRKEVCLLNLPPAEKKSPPRKNTGFSGKTAPGDPAIPTFNERDRLAFMKICGIRLLSQCVKTESLTESWRPCPPMQAMVRSLIPHVQKFLYHHEELANIYSELVKDNIAEKIKRLKFAQVGKLYICYQLEVDDYEDTVVEMTDVICQLKDKKELCIQKDHLTAKLDICRELVKLFFTDSGHRKELMNFLNGLIASLSDPAALKRFLIKEDIRELPIEEEQWEVPEPPRPEVTLERTPSRCPTSTNSPGESSHPGQQDGNTTLISWPPRASVVKTGSHNSGRADEAAVEAALKMWPPPAAPKENDISVKGSRQIVSQSSKNSNTDGDDHLKNTNSGTSPPLGPQRIAWQSNTADATGTKQPPGHHQPCETSTSACTESREETSEKSLTDPEPASDIPSVQPIEAASEQLTPDSLAVPEAVVLPSTFKGSQKAAETQRLPLNLDFPMWNKLTPPHATLEDLDVTCQRPATVVITEDHRDMKAIGEWGELLVNSFLCHWRDGEEPSRPTQVVWCNQSGESGQPYDFELTFKRGDAVAEVVYVEVKSTKKKERSFIVLSANELHFALNKKERYHIFRVYNAGDAQNVRLCRIQNLAQHLHAKTLELFLFV